MKKKTLKENEKNQKEKRFFFSLQQNKPFQNTHTFEHNSLKFYYWRQCLVFYIVKLTQKQKQK